MCTSLPFSKAAVVQRLTRFGLEGSSQERDSEPVAVIKWKFEKSSLLTVSVLESLHPDITEVDEMNMYTPVKIFYEN